MVSNADVGLLVEEYQSLPALMGGERIETRSRVRCDEIAECLVRDADWSESAAEHLLQLARDYGVFMLRNGLALAIALGLEDGELGF